jgi:hypothetical protein
MPNRHSPHRLQNGLTSTFLDTRQGGVDVGSVNNGRTCQNRVGGQLELTRFDGHLIV